MDVDFTEVLPEEIWRIIFENLNTIDLLSCCQSASLTWLKILEDTKVIWLFDSVYAHILKYLSQHEALLCRSVCKKWRKAVDIFLENHEYHVPRSPPQNRRHLQLESYCGDILYKQVYEINLENKCQVRKFLSEMQHHPKNPFVGRSVSLKYSNETTISFLETFGQYIWHMKICLKNTGRYYAGPLISCLEFTPNLRKLELVGGTYGEIEIDDLIQYCSMRDAKEINLPDLKTVVLYFNHPVHDFDVSFLLNQILKRRKLQRVKIVSLEKFPWVPFGWSKLSDLDIVLHSNFQVENLTMLNAPLHRLTLRLNIENVSWKHVKVFLEHIRKTLRYLSLETFPVSKICLLDMLGKVTLTNLKTVQILNCLKATTKFVVGLGAIGLLENLHIGWDHMGNGDFAGVVSIEEQQREIVECFGELDSENATLWNSFRKLKVFTWESYDGEIIKRITREMFEYGMKTLIQNSIDIDK